MMLLEGLKLMIMGMTTVILFLVVMMYCIQATARLNKHHTALEQQLQKQGKRQDKVSSTTTVGVPIAVFAAAVAAYEAEGSQG